MKKIFTEETVMDPAACIVIRGEDHHHLSNVLRIQKGESLIVGDERGNEYTGIVEDIRKDMLALKLEERFVRKRILPNVVIAFGVLKGDKNDLLIQKCTETGVSRFVPVIMKNTIVELDGHKKEKRSERWKKIAREAAMQSCRERIPEVSEVISFEKINDFTEGLIRLYGDEASPEYLKAEHFKEHDKGRGFAVLIGPEGGIDQSEKNKLNAGGWLGVNFSPFILKSETACVFASAAIMSRY